MAGCAAYVGLRWHGAVPRPGWDDKGGRLTAIARSSEDYTRHASGSAALGFDIDAGSQPSLCPGSRCSSADSAAGLPVGGWP